MMNGLRIGAHQCVGFTFDLQLYILRARKFAKALPRFLKKVNRRDRLNIKALFAGFHPGQSEQIFGQPRHA